MDIILNFNKPKNITSHDAVLIVKKLLGCKKAGHAGTLDPIAEGVLIICLDKATKITRYISELEKEYVFRMGLGKRTDTFDVTGKIVDEVKEFYVDEDRIKKVLRNYIGVIEQVPPMYSAIKVKGKPLYKLARKGVEVERPKRKVEIYSIDLLRFELPYLDLKVVCSKGTYVRVLCDDIGKELGTFGYMASLIRTRVGYFKIEDSITINDLKSSDIKYYKMDDVLEGILNNRL
jgi:tRNA pseudouridine55 synthase